MLPNEKNSLRGLKSLVAHSVENKRLILSFILPGKKNRGWLDMGQLFDMCVIVSVCVVYQLTRNAVFRDLASEPI